MSIVKKIKVFTSDDRGEIIDIFTHEPKDHCTIVTFTKNAVRGNHFHKVSIQSAYVLDGIFEIHNVMVDVDFRYDPKKIEVIKTTKGDYITHEKFEARTGHRILERYGMTETNMNTSNPYDGERREGTVGFPLPGVEIKITDSKTGDVLADGEIGEIEVRGPNVFSGYWQMPEKTAEELRNDGFFITGDLGTIDSDGYLHISGRNKDVIISGGYNIYPKEIELLLDEQPGVMESAVIGLEHPDLGEVVVGILVAEKGETPDLDDLTIIFSESLAKYKQPRKLLIIPELPRNTMGKVQKNILRQEYKDVLIKLD